jgi:hypothetical protein
MTKMHASADPPPTLAERDLHTLQRKTFRYFWSETNPENGLLADNTLGNIPASIAGVGMALSSYPVGVERGFLPRRVALGRALTALRFFVDSDQGTAPDSTGYRGFYYHFLDVRTGRRAWNCELSTIDTAILIAGALTVAAYFDSASPKERELRTLATKMFGQVDWRWAQDHGASLTHGWTPERGFERHRWHGYNEALLLYVLALGSDTYSLPKTSDSAWTKTYTLETAVQSRVSLRWATFHASAVARLDRFSRYPG